MLPNRPLSGVVSMSSLSRRNFTAPLFLVFLMVAMSWSSVLDNRHDAQTETTLSDIVVAHVGWSSPTTLDSTDSVGYQSSLAIDSNDNLHVTYRDNTNGNLEYMAYDGSSWSTPVSLDSTDNVGYQSSLAIDSNDNLHATYFDATNQNLEYTTYDGSSWSTPISLDSTGHVGYDSSLAIDSSDNLHVTYRDGTNGNLEYMTYDGSSWSTPVSLDSTDNVGRDSSLAIDSNDNLHVTYFDETNYNLEYMAYDGSSWSTPVSIDSTDNVGRQSSLAIDSNDNLHVTYLDETNWNLEYMTYDGSSWSTPVSLDSTDIVGSESSLAIDSNDNLHVTYYDNTNYNLEYMTYDGSSWSTPVSLDSTGNVGLYCSLAIDSNDNLHVTYFDAPNGNLEYVTYSTPALPVISYSPDDLSLTNNTASSDVPLSPTLTGSGAITSWTIHPTLPNGLSFSTSNGTIAGTPIELLTRTMFTVNGTNTGGSSTAYINLTVVDNLPNISYSPDDLSLTNNAALSPTAVPVNTGGPIPSGANTTVTQLRIVDAVGDVGEYSSFALDSTGSKHISYYDATNGDLKYATDTTGSWLNSTIDSNGDVGQYSSIAVDSNDVIHISYYDESNGNLMYITNRSGSWVNTTIDSTGQLGMDASVVGLYTSIAIDSNAKVHLSYLHLNSSIDTYLKYATDMTGSWVTETAFNTTTGGTIRAGHYSSIALDSNDEVHISAYDDYNRDLIHVTKKTGSWVKTTVQSFANVGLYTSLAIDSNDDLHIAYQMGIYSSVGENLRYATYNGSTGWTLTEIDILGSVGSFASLALDSNGFVHISYYDGTNQQLKYTTNLNGSWELSVIDSVGVGSHTSISVDATGAVDISYYDVLNGDLLSSRLDSSYNVYRFTVSPDLPTGLELNITNGEISGTPTVVSPLTTYSVTATNTGGSSTTLINITVVDNLPILSYSPDDLILINNTASSDVPLSPTLTGSGAITSWTIHPTLPNGLSFSTSNGTITGTPIELLTRTMFTVNGTNTGGSSTAYINLTVVDNLPILSYSPDDLSLNNNTASSDVPLSPTLTGSGVILSWTIHPTLPNGLSFSTSNGTITGTPIELLTRTMFTITAANSGGVATTFINITVNAVVPTLTYSPESITLTNNSEMILLSPTNSGGDIVSWSITPALSHGLNFDTTNGQISGTPIALQPLTMYTITATNTGGSITATVNITVNDELATLSYSPGELVLTRGINMAALDSLTGGGAILTWSISPALPTGLSFGETNGSIWGASSVNMTRTQYTVLVENSGGSVTSMFNLTVNEPLAIVTYPFENITLTRSLDMTPFTPELSGGFVATWEIEPSLPLGLNLSDGTILGIPLVNSTRTSYTVWANNTGGSVASTFNLTINEPLAIVTYPFENITLTRTSDMTPLVPELSGGFVATWEIEPMLPDGLSFDNGILSGTPTVNMSQTMFTIWANNSGGPSISSLNMTILEPIPSVIYSPENLTLIRGETMEILKPELGIGFVEIWEINATLPDGLLFDNGSISGTPLFNSTTSSYTVRAENSGGFFLVVINITVVEPTSVLSINPAEFTILRDDTTMAVQVNNSGGMVEQWQIYPFLPSGLTMENGFISGIATENSSAILYTIWGNNSGGSDSVSFTLTVENPERVSIQSSPDSTPISPLFLLFGVLLVLMLLLTLLGIFSRKQEEEQKEKQDEGLLAEQEEENSSTSDETLSETSPEKEVVDLPEHSDSTQVDEEE